MHGHINKIALNEACEQCWLICHEYMHMTWPAYVMEVKRPGSKANVVSTLVTENWERRRSGHRGPHEEEEVCISLGKVVEIDEAYEVRDEGDVAKAISKTKLTKDLKDRMGKVNLPDELGLDGLVAFNHPVLPRKTLHIRSTFVIVSANTIIKPSEIMYADHPRDEWGHRAKVQKVLTNGDGTSSDVKYTFNEWLDANTKQPSVTDSPSHNKAGPASASSPGVVRQVVGVAASSITKQDGSFVAGQSSPAVLKRAVSRLRLDASQSSPHQMTSDITTNAGSDDIADLASVAEMGPGNYCEIELI